MGRIHLLSNDLKNKIAAGEVVERPASVVKELVENSLDANSTEINIFVSGGGNSSLKVVDNGDGLFKNDLVLAFSRHSTSKISTVNDLSNIQTLGFRGEALASIASVATVKAQSLENNNETGYEISVLEGKITKPMPVIMEKGTSISISDLFFSIPARRKFLKSSKTELRHIVRMIRRFSLSFPEVKFNLFSDRKSILKLNPSTLPERITAVYDPTYRDNLLEVNHQSDLFNINGYIGNLNLVRKRRGEQNLFLNRRYIINRLLNSAIYSAFKTIISRGEFPFFVINLEIPNELVDINVHPMKTEVRFRDEWRIYHTLKTAISNSLKEILSTIPNFQTKSEFYPKIDNQSSLAFKKTRSSSILSDSSIERAKSYVQKISEIQDEEDVSLDKIWQVHNKYIVSEIKSGLVIIDQHVAHERILYEQAIDAMEGNPLPTQTLLFPEIIEFQPEDFSILLELIPYLEKIGFQMKEFGKYTIMTEGAPSEIQWNNAREVMREIIDTYRNEQKAQPSFMEAVSASFACKASVKAGDILTIEEMRSLVDRLFASKHPYYCPHGRPIIINLSLDEIDRRFERT